MLKNKEELIKQNIQEVINSWDPIGLMNYVQKMNMNQK